MAPAPGTDQGSDEFDPGYREWRAAQMRALDDDYRAWRNDGHALFSEEFTAWRDEREKRRVRGEDAGTRPPDEQGNAITSPEQNENVAERVRQEAQENEAGARV